MAKKSTVVDPKTTIMQGLLAEPGEALDDNEQDALAIEERGEEPSEPIETVTEEPTKPEVVAKEEPKAEPTKEAKPEAEEDDTKLSPAQQRIRELVAQRKAAEQEAQEYKERFARIDERSKYIQEQQEAEAKRIAEERANAQRAALRPDPTIDPVGAELFDLREQQQMYANQVQRLTAELNQRLNQTQVATEVDRFQMALNNDLMNARSKYSDYNEAASFATQERFNWWKQVGCTDDVAWQRVNAEALGVAKEMLDQGKSPTDAFYQLAKTWGYKGNGKAPAGVPAGDNRITAKEKLDQIAEGQKVTGFGKTANESEGDGVDIAHMTGSDLGQMSEEDFMFYAHHPDPKVKRAFQKRVQQIELGE